MTTIQHKLQYHLAIDVNRKVTKNRLFQISNKSSNTIITSHLKNKIKIVMFMSFELNEAKTTYFNTKRECLIIVKTLAKVKWLMTNNK